MSAWLKLPLKQGIFLAWPKTNMFSFECFHGALNQSLDVHVYRNVVTICDSPENPVKRSEWMQTVSHRMTMLHIAMVTTCTSTVYPYSVRSRSATTDLHYLSSTCMPIYRWLL